MSPNSLPSPTENPIPNALTNSEKIVLADHKRALAQKKASRPPPSKKRKTLPPPDEMEATVADAEQAKRVKDLAAERKIAIRTGKGKALTKAQKIAAAKKQMEARKKAKGKRSEGFGAKDLKKLVARELGFEKEPAKKGKVLGSTSKRKVEKAKSAFSLVMEQDGGLPSGGAFVGVGRTLGGLVEEADDGDDEDDGCV